MSASRPTRMRLDALRAFARLYGYVRYFHPSDEAAAMDWNRFVVHAAGRVLRAGNARELKWTLEELFLPIAPTVRLYAGRPSRPERPEIPPAGLGAGRTTSWQHLGVTDCNHRRWPIYRSLRTNRVNRVVFGDGKARVIDKPVGFKEVPRFGEATIEPLGAGLWCRVPLALRIVRNRTWSSPSPVPLGSLKRQLARIPPRNLEASRQEVRMASIIVAWNVYQHFYPYFDIVKVDWDSVLSGTLREAVNTGGGEDFKRLLKRLVAKTRDGHGGVGGPGTPGRWGCPPFRLDWIEGKIVIDLVWEDCPLRPGDILLEIDGKPATRILAYEESVVSGSPQWVKVSALNKLGYGMYGTKARLTVSREGRVLRFVSPRTSTKSAMWDPGPKTPFAELAPGVFYVNLPEFSDEELGKKMPVLATARAVVFDMRGYPDKGVTSVLNHLLRKEDEAGAWMRIPRIIHPDRERLVGYECEGWNLRPMRPRIRGKVVFLTDARAISYAESLMGFVEGYKLGPIVGAPTAGTNGNVNTMGLPGRYTINFTGMRVVKHDGSRHHLIGIRPTVPVERTIRGVREGRDEFLERALVEIGADPALARTAAKPAPPPRPRKTFILVFGPPVVGKMTVGQHLCRRTGYRLLHNHMTIDPLASIFGFGTERFGRLLFETRRRILEEAAADPGVPGVVMTYSWVFGNPTCTRQVAAFIRPFRRRGARVLLVGLDASLRERLRRSRTANRLRHKPGMRDLKLSESIIRRYGFRSSMPPEGWRAPAPWLQLDTTKLSARATAQAIQRHFGLSRPPAGTSSV
ncbi:MAG: S41 family peptidase [Candidatus Coatesbacteria bacterium]